VVPRRSFLALRPLCWDAGLFLYLKADANSSFDAIMFAFPCILKEEKDMSIYWKKEIECMSREEIKKLQSKKLIETVTLVYNNVPFYRERMDNAGIKPSDISSVDDLKNLPFCTKADLRDNYPFGTFASPMEDIVRIHASSGTTGKPTVVGYTHNDIEIWTDCVARALYSVGITKRDIIHISYGYGMFTGGLGIHYGAERVGASVVPASVGNTSRQIQLLKDFQTTAVCCTPSYILHLSDEMAAMGIGKDDLALKVGIFGAEPWSDEMRADIENRMGIKAYDIYGLSETMGPGVSMECTAKAGMHIPSDYFIAEIIDPETGEVLPEGRQGEIVFTSLGRTGMPLIRYRTRDLTTLTYETCECGRTSPRMGKVKGRSDDMLIIRGVNVFPSQIESVILRFAEIEPYYMIYVDRINNSDILEVHVEMNEDFFSDEVRKLEVLERRLVSELNSVLGIHAKVRLVEPKSIKRFEGKAQRIIDKRKV
jgi:phenylacetate-CoA ligase